MLDDPYRFSLRRLVHSDFKSWDDYYGTIIDIAIKLGTPSSDGVITLDKSWEWWFSPCDHFGESAPAGSHRYYAREAMAFIDGVKRGSASAEVNQRHDGAPRISIRPEAMHNLKRARDVSAAIDDKVGVNESILTKLTTLPDLFDSFLAWLREAVEAGAVDGPTYGTDEARLPRVETAERLGPIVAALESVKLDLPANIAGQLNRFPSLAANAQIFKVGDADYGDVFPVQKAIVNRLSIEVRKFKEWLDGSLGPVLMPAETMPSLADGLPIVEQPPPASATVTPAGGQVEDDEANERDQESLPFTPRKPRPEQEKIYQVRQIMVQLGEHATQDSIVAKCLNNGLVVSQPTVSRAIKVCEAWMLAGNTLAPPIEHSKPATIQLTKEIELGPRTNKRTERQRGPKMERDDE